MPQQVTDRLLQVRLSLGLRQPPPATYAKRQSAYYAPDGNAAAPAAVTHAHKKLTIYLTFALVMVLRSRVRSTHVIPFEVGQSQTAVPSKIDG